MDLSMVKVYNIIKLDNSWLDNSSMEYQTAYVVTI